MTRFLTAAALFVVCVVSLTSAQTAAPLAERQRDLAKLFDEYWQNQLKDSPEFASSVGDKRYNRELTDYSAETRNAHLARDLDLLQRLAAVDDSGMTDTEQLSRRLAIRELTQWQEAARFREWEMPVTQFGGFHTDLAQLWQQMTFANAQDYDDYVARLKLIPRVFEQQTNNMETGADDGRIPPKFLLEQVVGQVKDLVAKTGEASPFAMPLQQMPANISVAEKARIRREVLDAINSQVLPAYMRFQRFLEVSYVPKGRTDPGIWAIPDGDAYYAFLVRRETTTSQTPAEIHQRGLDELKRISAEEQGLFAKLGVKDVHELSAKIAADPKLHPASGAALVQTYRDYLKPMHDKLPQLFGKLPKSPLEVAPMPDYIAKNQAAAYYESGSAEAHRPGRVRVNEYDATHRTLTQVEAIAYHEGEPGHHLQISLALENTAMPQFRRYLGYTAFAEGWALYSERLGKDVGFYTDPYEDFGRLDNEAWRAVRLVVDTGVHAQHWTRQQMVDTFHQYTAMDDTNINAEVNRYIAMPAQALAYKTGQLKILELRDYAKQKLGAKFDIRAFHDEVLGAGALPLDTLDQRTRAWVDAQIAH